MGKRHISLAVLAALLSLTAAADAAPRDYGKLTLNILPPGESGGAAPTAHSTDQLRLYDALTPLQGNVTAADLMTETVAGFLPD